MSNPAVTPSPFLSVDLSTLTFPSAFALQIGLSEVDRNNVNPGTVSKGEVNELFLGAFGALFFGAATNAPIILTITGEGGAALAVPLVLPPVAAACLAFMAGFVAAVGAAGLIVHLFKKLGVNESYAPVTTGLALQSANDQSEVGVPSTLGFLANHDTDGFTGHYTATIRWHLR